MNEGDSTLSSGLDFTTSMPAQFDKDVDSALKDVAFVPRLGELVFSSAGSKAGLYFANPETGAWRNWQELPQNFVSAGYANGPLTAAGFVDPYGLAFDVAREALYVAEPILAIIRRVDYSAGDTPAVDVFAGESLYNQYLFLSDGPATDRGLHTPFALEVNELTGDLWVGSAGTGQLFRVSKDGVLKNISRYAGSLLETDDLVIQMIDGDVVHSQFCSIRAMTFSRAYDKLYILDGGDFCDLPTVIRELDMATMVVQTRFGRVDQDIASAGVQFWNAHVASPGRDGVLSELASGLDIDLNGVLYVNEACAQGGVIRRVDPTAGWSSQIVLGDGARSKCGERAQGYMTIEPSLDAPADAPVAGRTWTGAGGKANLFVARQSMGMLLMSIACGKYRLHGSPIPAACADGLNRNGTIAALDISAGSFARIAAHITSLAPVTVPSQSTLIVAAGMLVVPQLTMDSGAVLLVHLAATGTASPRVAVAGDVSLRAGARVMLQLAYGHVPQDGERVVLLAYDGAAHGAFDSTTFVCDGPGTSALRRLLGTGACASGVRAQTACHRGQCSALIRSRGNPQAGWIAAVVLLSLVAAALVVYFGVNALRWAQQRDERVAAGHA